MTPTRETYLALLASIPDAAVFFEPWYLDILAPGWEIALGYRGETPVAAWVYFPSRKGPLKLITMPPLVRFMGPLIAPDFRDPAHLQQLLPDLWQQIPRPHACVQQAHYTLEHWLPLHEKGFRQSTRFSYHIDLTRGVDDCRADLCAPYRNQKIPRAEKHYEVVESQDIDAFLAVQESSFRRQGLAVPVSEDTIRQLWLAVRSQNRGTLLLARHRTSGSIDSGAFLIWDRDTLYHLMAGDHPEGRRQSAGILVTWACIEYGCRHGFRRFDFLGSMIPSIAAVRRQFGARPVPYSTLSWFSHRVLALLWYWRHHR